MTSGRAGRQILQRKNSFNYLKELCKQTFVGIVPSRSGKLILNAWLDGEDLEDNERPFFDENAVIRNSIKNFTRTEPQDLYNKFQINYRYNSGADKFDRCLIVTNTDKIEFPKIEDKRWMSFVGGIPFNADDEDDINYTYFKSKHLWSQCREGYRFAGKIQQAPEALSDLYWCVDDSHAVAYLGNLIYWTTRPKAQVEFTVPINARINTLGGLSVRRNVELELLDKVFFKDKIYTNNDLITGYIIKIEPNVKKGEIKIGVIFEPDDYSDLIIERGVPLNDDKIIEEKQFNNNLITEGRNLL